jgi:hypothetical protein
MHPAHWRTELCSRRLHLSPEDWPLAALNLSSTAAEDGPIIMSVADVVLAASRSAWGLDRYVAALDAGASAGWLAPLEWRNGGLRTSLRIPEGA